MNSIVRTLGTPISPVLVQITNQMPASPVRPSGALEVVQTNPYLNPDGSTNGVAVAWTAVSTVSMAACAYHGYKRNEDIAWAIWWGFMGGFFPIITPTIAVAQGYGKREGR